MGWVTLELSLLFGAFAVQEEFAWILMIVYLGFPAVSHVSLIALHMFLHNPHKFVIKEIPGSEMVNLDLTMFSVYKEVYYQITINGRTAPMYWIVDFLGIALCIYMGDIHAPYFALAVITLILTEMSLREWFVTQVHSKGESFDEALENLLALQEKEGEEDE